MKRRSAPFNYSENESIATKASNRSSEVMSMETGISERSSCDFSQTFESSFEAETGDHIRSKEIMEALKAILKKCVKSFSGKEEQEAVSFMKSFHNLCTQHLSKQFKEAEKVKKIDEFVAQARDFLITERFLKSDLITLWMQERINTIERMTSFTKMNIDLPKLEEFLANEIVTKEPQKSKLETAEFSLKAEDIDNYTMI
eukprot:CAMPEP_0168352684 /NCGR_PEP_ID=MMETSP0213-20121227/22736_1 /TAXON_ID=151035 /ORGANISM="Euplotes harpa, Strain FSP1.4" /LENGTH=199 /DNA_ID=CAMNT_0008364019 /DNA_START=614 /DNA_END=1212 /DNA_ORIENTATION=+